ncbi:MAG TPA: hypothetical protein VGH54_10665 [Mycobacterium sp.]|jgi:hypothetical protein|uniref:hypothetical protein n=1 Tax=Mycobacterium sp. TaxID=1785 RepID=UPI002F40BD3E
MTRTPKSAASSDADAAAAATAAADDNASTDIAEAAKVLGCYESEVTSVEDTEAGTVATTFDGQRYLISDGDFVWLKAPSTAPQILAD